MALVMLSRPTNWGTTACLAGMRNAQTHPWIAAEPIRCQIVMVAVETESPMKRDMTAMTSWPTWMTRLRSTRSAITPPKREKSRMGGANAAPARPTILIDSVRSQASWARATICMLTAAISAISPNQK